MKLPILLWEADKVFSVDTLTEEVSPITVEDLFLVTKKIRRLRGAGLPVPVFCLLIAQALKDTDGNHPSNLREVTFQSIVEVMLNEILCFDIGHILIKAPILTALMQQGGFDTASLKRVPDYTIAYIIIRELRLAELEGFAERSNIQAAKEALKLMLAWYKMDSYPAVISEEVRALGRELAACEYRVHPDWSWGEFKSEVDSILRGSRRTLELVKSLCQGWAL